LGTPKNVVARVRAEIANYYNYYFSGKGQAFQSVDMNTENGPPTHGYVRRGTPVYKELLSILADGNPHDITLAISNIDEHTDHAVINAVLSRTWIMPDEDEKPPCSH